MAGTRSRRPSTGSPKVPQMRLLGWVFVILLVAGLYAWDRWADNNEPGKNPAAEKSQSTRTEKTKAPAKTTAPTGDATSGAWRKLENPRLVENRGNDGDSFFIAHSGGEERYRLYFVDTPETSRRYPDRLGHQARYFGGISFDNLINGGHEARKYSLDLLQRHQPEVWTKNERVMDSDRLHALVRFPDMPGKPWLHEELVKAGLARIYTMPTDLPDGTPKEKHVQQLKDLETGARREKRGLWKR